MLPKSPRRQDLRKAVALLRHGQVIAYPTEGVWGLGCDPRRRPALRHILRLKKRPQHKGVLLIAATRSQAARFADLDAVEEQVLGRYWPGTTLVLPARKEAAAWLRGQHGGIAIRVTHHEASRRLCRSFGRAIVSTSANPAGLQAARDLRTLKRYFGARVWALPARLGGQRRPSRIIDAVTGRILRS
ncbi:L-threonylcarbamoyladenylate synthase [Acidithiobacillus caldus]|jgi:L-threonylcarbamoyladenylate synthase|uniref:L-threonylcarbamoyladenylate synthase n=1 Tax=Acidithiobacillus caldus (strain ATCC 51756 / DSM 8584 / KU) TaxID=637389 RepID=A0A059ZSX4_ACICK|nr:L-threonylcarbamoyladenylate synthase [Acidithiobacillus caldus]AIA54598.1 TsaC protein (YrdC domain) required for threonylcarbamoyladenosine t(6)A37 modification in tRNA [Acidithiobacillus caldus ATCC 51756]MBU2728678.1 L-threonylcarbamoyladenylate synthase [Acidithiobacillus caldus]MBU2735839.1 L-threonylcarbamoyladenylate synthase [Acidithiobacillus caldus ATCC 51756]MBU2745965.1 L-threonylcarbamoyladenylate synthase [Acidithiobacillus caldus]MBU2762163.1 L-threonylcarbamoyladenylate syn